MTRRSAYYHYHFKYDIQSIDEQYDIQSALIVVVVVVVAKTIILLLANTTPKSVK